jgi:DNA-binding MarR family transcriptional regulator
MRAVPKAPAETHDDRRAVEAVRALSRVARVLERSCDGLSLAHYRVLSAVGSGDERASRLATRLAVGKPAISAAVESLCARGMLVRTAVEGDQRAISLRLTPEGARLLAVAEAEMTARLRSLVARTGSPDRVLDACIEVGAAVDAHLAEHRR